MRFYLDHNACTAVDPRVMERFARVESECPANPSSLHSSGRQARRSLEASRSEVAAALGVNTDQVFFLSGGSEANNLAVAGAGAADLDVLLAPIEHPSVLAAAERRGARWWSVTSDARAVVKQMPDPAGLVCLVHAQNEVGTLQPLAQAREVADQMAAPLHIDASQTLGRVDLEEAVRLAETLTLSAHKVGGLRGGSVLIAKAANRLRPLIVGGEQELGLRPGTVSPALAASTALSVRLAVEEQPMRAAAMAAARHAFAACLDAETRSRCLTPEHALPNTAMYLFDGVDGRNLLPALDMAGIDASQGSACSSGSPAPPRVLSAMGFGADDARRCVRFSFSHLTSEDDAALAGKIVRRVVQSMQPPREHGAH